MRLCGPIGGSCRLIALRNRLLPLSCRVPVAWLQVVSFFPNPAPCPAPTAPAAPAAADIIGWSAYDVFLENYLAHFPPGQVRAGRVPACVCVCVCVCVC